MRNKILALALCALAAQGASAKVRTTKQMLGEAARVLASKGSRLKAMQAAGELKVIKREAQLTVVGYEGGRCVVVANDDTFQPVLAYYDAAPDGNDNPALQWWMESMNQSLAQQLADGSLPFDNERKDTYKAEVAPMLTTAWGQDEPYSNLTPTYTSGSRTFHYVTGCVATAMAQVLKYHRFPEKGKSYNSWTFYPNGSNASGVNTRVNFTTKYDWDNMLDSYTGAYTDEQAKAVATLMRDCGAAASMQYAPDGSGANNNTAVKGMRKNLRFDHATKNYYRDYMPKAIWMDMVYEELDAGRPIIYGGTTTSGGGHEFVFDGYDNDGLVHVDWGWEGSGNGYFDVALLNSQQGSFTAGQDMILVRVPETTDKGYHSMFGTSGLSITSAGTSMTISGAVYNMDDETFNGRLAVVAYNVDTDIAMIMNGYTLPELDFGYGYQNFTATFDASQLEDGTYQVYLATNSTDADLAEDGWYPVFGSERVTSNFLLTVSGGKCTVKKGNADWSLPTGISHTTASAAGASADKRVYSIDGRRVADNLDNAGSGLYIVNGKKIIK